MGNLTALKIKSLTTPGRYMDGDGLMLVVGKTGSKSWVLRHQVANKRRDFGLGSYKDLTIADAREAAAQIRKSHRNGVDPVGAKRAARLASAEQLTFRAAAEQAHTELRGGWKNGKHRDQWISTLRTYAYPKIGELTLDAITGPILIETLRPIWLSKPETARRVKQRIGAVLDWGYSKGRRKDAAPMRALDKGLPRQPKKNNHFTALPYLEMPALMLKLAESETSGRLALRFLILTAARSGEVRKATWEEIDEDARLWTIPASHMKAGNEHTVPLTDAALSVLRIARMGRRGYAGEPIFPGLRGSQLSDMTLTKALRAATTNAATVHGFRSSFRDWAAEKTDFDGSVVEAALAHTNPNRTEAAYKRTNYLDKRRPLMNGWADFLLPSVASPVLLELAA